MRSIHRPVEHLERRRLFSWTISGRVVDSEPGVLGPIVTGMPGAAVYADLNRNAMPDGGEPTVQSDASGNYTLAGSGSASFTVRETPPPGGPHLASGESGFRDVSITDGQSLTLPDFQDSQVATLSGSVFEDTNRNGVRDSGEPGLANWTIQSSTDPDQPRAVTDANGNWSMSVAGGVYDVTLEGDPATGLLDNWVVTAPIGGVQRVLVTGNDVGGLDFGVSPKGTAGTAAANLVVASGAVQARLPLVVAGGESGYVRFRVANQGNALPAGPVPVTVYASSFVNFGGTDDVLLKSGDTVLTTDQERLNVPPGKSRQVNISFKLPARMAAGSYGLVVVVGPLNADPAASANTAGQGEVRFLHGDTTFTVPPDVVDLAVSVGSVPLRLGSGRSGSVAISIRNAGAMTASGSADLKVYASTDQTLDAGDILVGQASEMRVRLRSTRSKSLRVRITPTLPAGTYFMIVSMTPSVTPADANAANDVASSSDAVVVP